MKISSRWCTKTGTTAERGGVKWRLVMTRWSIVEKVKREIE